MAWSRDDCVLLRLGDSRRSGRGAVRRGWLGKAEIAAALHFEAGQHLDIALLHARRLGAGRAGVGGELRPLFLELVARRGLVMDAALIGIGLVACRRRGAGALT